MSEGRKVEIVGRVDTTKEAGPPRWDPADAAPFIERAGKAMQDGDLDRAASIYAEGATAHKHDPRLQGGLALVAMQRQDWDAAILHGKAAAGMRDPGMEVHYNLGWSFFQSGDKDAAISSWLEAFRADPSRPEPIHQLVRFGRVPHLDGEEEGEPLPLGTLERLELYDSVGRIVHHEGGDGTFKYTVQWAIDRGAPWGRIVAWLAAQGVHDDASLVTILSTRDQHLADSFVSGFLICNTKELAKAAVQAEDLVLLDEGSEPSGQGVLSVRPDEDGKRALVPLQRTSAAHVVGLVQGIFPMLGPNATLVLVVDPAAHLGPRRLWFVTPVADHEIVGEWAGTMEDGSPAPEQVIPDDSPIPAESVPLYVPGVDKAQLEALIKEHLLQDIITAVEPDGMATVRADHVGRYEGAWLAFLSRVAKNVPAGNASLARWRERDADRLAILRPAEGVELVKLRCSWPAHITAAEDIAIPEPVQFLGRALFQAPRPNLSPDRGA